MTAIHKIQTARSAAAALLAAISGTIGDDEQAAHPIFLSEDAMTNSDRSPLLVALDRQFDETYRLKAINAALVEALKSVIAATRAYLPHDGITAQECLNRILAATDNPRINDALALAEASATAEVE